MANGVIRAGQTRREEEKRKISEVLLLLLIVNGRKEFGAGFRDGRWQAVGTRREDSRALGWGGPTIAIYCTCGWEEVRVWRAYRFPGQVGLGADSSDRDARSFSRPLGPTRLSSKGKN